MDHTNLTSSTVKAHHLGESPLAQARNAENRRGEIADLRALERACKDFESIFVYTLLKTMRQSLPKPEEAGMGRDVYTSMGDLEVARFVAEGRGIGLGDLLFEQLRDTVR